MLVIGLCTTGEKRSGGCERLGEVVARHERGRARRAALGED
jgi:hypothetical protein